MSNPVAIGSDRASESAGNAATRPAAGWWLNFIAGFVPLAAGLVVLVTTGSASPAPILPGGPGLERLTFRIRVCGRLDPMHHAGWSCSARSAESTS